MRSNSALLPGAGFDVSALLAPQQALTLYFAQAAQPLLRIETVAIENAYDRVLAEPIVADAPYPAAARSAMDGFAIRSSEVPGRLRIAGEIVMGLAWPHPLDRQCALRIPTGGVVPPGADAIVPLEDVRVEGDYLEVPHAVPQHDAITPAASDMRAGETVLEPGRIVRAAELGVLATLGVVNVPVFCKPVVAVLSSGNELIDAAAAPTVAQVRDSNRWAIAGALQSFGASVRHVPSARDDRDALLTAARAALATADALVLSGGSSVGERDLTPAIVAALGTPGVIVHGLRVKPGKPTVLGNVRGKPVIGLPGNPASALMILEAVAAPIFCALARRQSHLSTVGATLSADYVKRPGWTWFAPVRLQKSAGELLAHPLPMRSSSVSLLARASGFLVLDENVETLRAGEPVRVTCFAGGSTS